jgi:hypothetical protein
MAHLTLQEVIDRVNGNHFYYSTRKLQGVKTRPHHPEYYVPRITRFLAGLMFGAFPAASKMATVQKADARYSVVS